MSMIVEDVMDVALSGSVVDETEVPVGDLLEAYGDESDDDKGVHSA
ncbi:MAG: hypothetical protein WC742_12855 [Gallionellaceae bacterium]